MGNELSIFSGNKMRSHVEATGVCKLVLSSGVVLVLEKNFYVSSVSRNLISISTFVPFGYSLNFLDISLSLSYKSDLVGYGTLSNGLYCLNLKNDTSLHVMHVHAGTKRCVMNEDSSMLWHRRLGHFSQQRIK